MKFLRLYILTTHASVNGKNYISRKKATNATEITWFDIYLSLFFVDLEGVEKCIELKTNKISTQKDVMMAKKSYVHMY